jgi:hypothetical protein
MRKPVSILLAFIFLFNIGGYYFVFRVVQLQVKRQAQNQIRQRIKDDNLCLIVVPVHAKMGIRWIRQGKEFSYRGEMFDVVRTENKANNKYFYCIRDKKEKELLASFLKTTKSKKDTDKKQKRISTERYFQKVSFLNNTVYPSHIHYNTIEVSLVSNCLVTPSPPPKAA